MRNSPLFVAVATILVLCCLGYQADAAPAGMLMRQLSSLLKWTNPVSRTPQSDGNVVQFENGYLVETVVEGNDIGVLPYKIRVSDDGELYAVDEVNSNIVKITPPLSQYSRGRLVAGSFQGYTGHVDGKPSDARFNHPQGVTMDDKGNVYVADTTNLAIRKIGDSGVTTIAGGKSITAGYRDGPSEDAKFSNDFDIVYIRPTCSLLVVDRGNAALRQISLSEEDCDLQQDSVSSADFLMVIGAVVVGYAACLLHQGYGPFSSLRRKQSSHTDLKAQPKKEEEKKPSLIVENLKDEEPGWPSFGQLILDLSKLAIEAFGAIFLYFFPSNLSISTLSPKKGLTPLKDKLKMPEDEAIQRQRTPNPLSETRQIHPPTTDNINISETSKPLKFKSGSFRVRDPSVKHRSSKKQEYAEFYGLGETPPLYSKTKIQKDRSSRHRHKSGEVVFGAEQQKPPSEVKPKEYENPKFEPYHVRNKYGSDDSTTFRF